LKCFHHFFFFLVERRASHLQNKLYCWSHTSSTFCCDCFGDGVLWTTCLDWSWIVILLISASQLARIIGLSLLCQASITSWMHENSGHHMEFRSQKIEFLMFTSQIANFTLLFCPKKLFKSPDLLVYIFSSQCFI
jgi:hypothetical protein